MLLKSMHFAGQGDRAELLARVARVAADEWVIEIEGGRGFRNQRIRCATARYAADRLLELIDGNSSPTYGDLLGYERLLDALDSSVPDPGGAPGEAIIRPPDRRIA